MVTRSRQGATRSLPLEGRVAAKRPGGVLSTGTTFSSRRALPQRPHPARCAGHPPLEGEGSRSAVEAA
jgi:hypothetical protein